MVVVTHPDPDILEGEVKVKWSLGTTAVSKASGCTGIPEELYKKDLHDQDNHDGVITS